MAIVLAVGIAPAGAETTANRISSLISKGKCGSTLQSMMMERCVGIGPYNRPYVFNGIGDCYGFCRQVWNAILSDGGTHSEDYYPNSYDTSRWIGLSGGIPVGTYPDSN